MMGRTPTKCPGPGHARCPDKAPRRKDGGRCARCAKQFDIERTKEWQEANPNKVNRRKREGRYANISKSKAEGIAARKVEGPKPGIKGALEVIRAMQNLAT